MMLDSFVELELCNHIGNLLCRPMNILWSFKGNVAFLILIKV